MCEHVKIGDGLTAIVCGGHRRMPVCKAKAADGAVCGRAGVYQCDWKISKRLTCDRHICAEHAQEAGPEKHLCPDHQQAYRIWQAARAAKISNTEAQHGTD